MKELIKQIATFKYFNLKISLELLDRIKQLAKQNHRSATGEMLVALEYYLENEGKE